MENFRIPGANTSLWSIQSSRPVVNITIVSYLLFHAKILPTRSYVGPALELAVQRLRKKHNFNVSLAYVGRDDIRTVPDMIANLYLVAEYYYDKWDRNGIIAFIVPGTLRNMI